VVEKLSEKERFAKYFQELASWMPEPDSDWKEKCRVSKYDAIYEARINAERYNGE
jgi:hypothetical protein